MNAIAIIRDDGGLDNAAIQPFHERDAQIACVGVNTRHSIVADHHSFPCDVINSELQLEAVGILKPVGRGVFGISAIIPVSFGLGHEWESQHDGKQ